MRRSQITKGKTSPMGKPSTNWDKSKKKAKKKSGKKKTAAKKSGKKKGKGKGPTETDNVVSMRRDGGKGEPGQQTVVPGALEDYDEELNEMGLRVRKARKAKAVANEKVKKLNAIGIELLRKKGLTVYEDNDVKLSLLELDDKLEVEDKRPKEEQ